MTRKQTPLEEQYFKIKAQHPDKILFFRMGDFYEMFGRDAEIAAPILGIALTSRAHGKSTRMPLAGVPYHAADKYLSQLLQAGHKVAICEQTEDPKQAKGLVRREVIEVITPGTITVDGVLPENRENMILSLYAAEDAAGLAALELATGRVLVYQSDIRLTLERAEVIDAREILVPESLQNGIGERLARLTAVVTKLEDFKYQHDDAALRIKNYYGVHSLDAFGLLSLPLAVSALGSLIAYLDEVKFGVPTHLEPPRLAEEPETIYLDSATLCNLEILQPQATNIKEHSLLGLLDFCKTVGGQRLLARWLAAPLKKLERIKERLQSVQKLADDQKLRDKLTGLLTDLADLERIAGKLGYRKANPKDLIQLKNSLKQVPAIKTLLSKANTMLFDRVAEMLPDLSAIAELIEAAIKDDPPYLTGNGSLIKDDYSDELDELKTSIKEAVDYIAGLQKSLRRDTGIPSLRVGYNKVFGYYIEVTKVHADKVPDHFIRKQTLVNAERYITAQMKEKEELILAAEEKINKHEEELFFQVRDSVAAHVEEISLTGRLISEVDVIGSYAAAARRHNYSRPAFDESQSLEIVEGRHPIIENVLPRGDFVANDTSLDIDGEQLQLLTGPNMAGKSTYLRQVGLIVIMAQAGSFVPAARARIGIVDRVFTRVGASDRLALGESTFLVEMNDTSRILANATPKSLVLLDEVGRGTSTYDGLAIAWALCETLHEQPHLRSRTIFATHFHELTELARLFDRIRNYQVQVRRWQDKIIFLRKVMPGGCDDSFGIEVAKLAGLPQSVTDRAREILKSLERGSFDPVGNRGKKKRDQINQLGLFEQKVSEVSSRLQDLEVEKITPLQALNMLVELKALAESENDR
ncbi:MAG: DNA mismatch repair protein MutS [candidate division Zixibacteria bacterium]|nr:DNA mismatch repair protein MutS [candidate division Zixibacteria bacterium]